MSEADAAAKRAECIARLLADAPPPTPRQVAIVRANLGDAAIARSRRVDTASRRVA